MDEEFIRNRITELRLKLHAALHACTTMNENQVQQTRQHDKI